MSGWRTMDELPQQPCGVLFWTADKSYIGNPEILTAGWDYSFEIGYFDGREFREQGTGHSLNERKPPDGYGIYPTHWQPLPEPPIPHETEVNEWLDQIEADARIETMASQSNGEG